MTTYTWIGATAGDWSAAGDWTPAGGPPGSVDTASILAGGTVSVTQAESIDGLNLAPGAMLSARPVSRSPSLGRSTPAGRCSTAARFWWPAPRSR